MSFFMFKIFDGDNGANLNCGLFLARKARAFMLLQYYFLLFKSSYYYYYVKY